MKFFKSFLVIATVLATTQAVSWDDVNSISQTLTMNFQNLYISNIFPSPETYSSTFDNMASMLTSQYQPGTITPVQQAGIDYVVTTKNSYKDVYNSIVDNINNQKAWIMGNYTQYAAVYSSLLNDYVTAAKAAVASIDGKAGCGPMDPDYLKSTIMMPAYTIFSGSSTPVTNNLMYLSSMISTNLLTNFQMFTYSFLSDADPVGYMKALEASTIYPGQNLMNGQITAVGSMVISMIKNTMDASVANIKTQIANIPTTASTYQCTGN